MCALDLRESDRGAQVAAAAVTGRRIPFGRTREVHDRSATPSLYIAVTLAFPVQCAAVMVFDVRAGNVAHALVMAVNVGMLALAVTRFVGWREATADLGAPLRRLP